MFEISRRSNVEPFRVMEMMRHAARLEAQGRDIAHLEIGQPASAAPKLAREAAANALLDGAQMGYTVALGTDALRGRIARLYAERHSLDLDPARVVVTTGSSAGFLLAFIALCDAGERIALAAPGYPSYRNIMRALAVEPVTIEADLSTGYQPTPDLLAAARRGGALRAVLAASPANPTGTMLSRPEMSALIDDCASHGEAFISDEIYQGLDYGAPAVTALDLSDDAIVINSFSKYHCMTGWRIGWMVVPERLIRPVERLAQNHFICAPHISQIAALAALDATEELEGHRAAYARNRALLLEALPRLGFVDLAPSDGAFYVYAGLGDHGTDSEAFCRRMLEEAGVCTTPGLDFDAARGHRMIRFSFAASTAVIETAIERLEGWLNRAQ